MLMCASKNGKLDRNEILRLKSNGFSKSVFTVGVKEKLQYNKAQFLMGDWTGSQCSIYR